MKISKILTLLTISVIVHFSYAQTEEIEFIDIPSNGIPLKKIFISSSKKNQPLISQLRQILADVSRQSGQEIRLVVVKSKAGHVDYLRDYGKMVMVKFSKNDKKERVFLDLDHAKKDIPFTELFKQEAEVTSTIKIPFDHQNHDAGGNYGGNFDVTANRILMIGSTTNEALREFLIKKGKYEKTHVTLDTSWLKIGHIDEYISTIPAPPNDPCGVIILRSSPELALDLIRQAKHPPISWVQNYGDIVTCLKQNVPSWEKPEYDLSKKSCVDFIDDSAMIQNILRLHGDLSKILMGQAKNMDEYLKCEDRAFFIYKHQKSIEEVITQNEQKLSQKIKEKYPECKEVKTLKIPVLYSCSPTSDQTQPKNCSSLLPNSMNFINISGNNIIFPDSTISLFNKEIEKICAQNGITSHFVNTNIPYHQGYGDLHCATNELRVP